MRFDGGAWLAGVVAVLALAGCAGSRAATPGTATAVTDVASVAGRWTGLLDMEGSRDREDFVELVVDPSGVYRAVAARTIGMMDAQGTIAVAGNGTLILRGNRGSQATATLYTGGPPGPRLLVLEGATPAGRRFRAQLRQP
jgi:hypothetical protein